MAAKKQEIITFKVDGHLAEALKSIPNRSEFIRAAVLSAMDNVCMVCQGTGRMNPAQKAHWIAFVAEHQVQYCAECGANHIVCSHSEKSGKVHVHE